MEETIKNAPPLWRSSRTPEIRQLSWYIKTRTALELSQKPQKYLQPSAISVITLTNCFQTIKRGRWTQEKILVSIVTDRIYQPTLTINSIKNASPWGKILSNMYPQGSCSTCRNSYRTVTCKFRPGCSREIWKSPTKIKAQIWNTYTRESRLESGVIPLMMAIITMGALTGISI